MLYTAKGVRVHREELSLLLDRLSWSWRKKKKNQKIFRHADPFSGPMQEWTHMKSHRNEMFTVNPVWGWNESSCLCDFIAEVWIWLHSSCAHYRFPFRNLQLWDPCLSTLSFIVTSLQILLSYAPFFSTRYVKVQLFRQKVCGVQCTFRTISLDFISQFRVGFELT